jgi:hypothetical protein
MAHSVRLCRQLAIDTRPDAVRAAHIGIAHLGANLHPLSHAFPDGGFDGVPAVAFRGNRPSFHGILEFYDTKTLSVAANTLLDQGIMRRRVPKLSEIAMLPSLQPTVILSENTAHELTVEVRLGVRPPGWSNYETTGLCRRYSMSVTVMLRACADAIERVLDEHERTGAWMNGFAGNN